MGEYSDFLNETYTQRVMQQPPLIGWLPDGNFKELKTKQKEQNKTLIISANKKREVLSGSTY